MRAGSCKSWFLTVIKSYVVSAVFLGMFFSTYVFLRNGLRKKHEFVPMQSWVLVASYPPRSLSMLSSFTC